MSTTDQHQMARLNIRNLLLPMYQRNMADSEFWRCRARALCERVEKYGDDSHLCMAQAKMAQQHAWDSWEKARAYRAALLAAERAIQELEP